MQKLGPIVLRTCRRGSLQARLTLSTGRQKQLGFLVRAQIWSQCVWCCMNCPKLLPLRSWLKLSGYWNQAAFLALWYIPALPVRCSLPIWSRPQTDAHNHYATLVILLLGTLWNCQILWRSRGTESQTFSWEWDSVRRRQTLLSLMRLRFNSVLHAAYRHDLVSLVCNADVERKLNSSSRASVVLQEMDPLSPRFQQMFANPFAFVPFKATEPWLEEYINLDLKQAAVDVGFTTLSQESSTPAHFTFVAQKSAWMTVLEI